MGRQLFAALAAFCGFALVMLQIIKNNFQCNAGTNNIEPSVANIGNEMLGVNGSGYALPFEVVSILLLAALIGCIVIAVRSKTQTT